MMRYNRHYSKWHNHQDPNYVKFMKRKFQHTFDQHLPQNKDADILEIGCANGMALLALRELGYTNMLGIEIDQELATIAKGFELNVMNIDAFKFVTETEKTFDFIYMFDVLEHFKPDNIPHFLNSTFNLLRENGKLMLVVPNATSPAGSYFRYIDWTHQVSFTPTSISHLLEEAGFKHIVIEDESLIQEPRKEDYQNDLAYQDAKKRFDKYRFYESFAKWELASMFGNDRYSLLVAPNIKIVATKFLESEVSVDIRYKNKDILEFDEIVNWIISHLKEFNENDIPNRLLRLEEQIVGRINQSIKEIAYKIQENDENAFESKLFLNQLKDRFNVKSQFLDEKMREIEMSIQSTEVLLRDIKEAINNKERVMNNKIEDIIKSQHNIIRHLYTKKNKMINKAFIRIRMPKLKKIIRDSNYFDEEFYLNEYSDVKHMKFDPIEHYLIHGSFEGRNPSKQFNTLEYIQSHPEVLESNINPLIHKIINEKK